MIGGLNPDFLAPRAPVPHLGTTDVDLLFELGFSYDREEQNFEWLDRVLERGGFTERRGFAGWQWEAELEGSFVRLDLLCDVDDNLGQPIALPGAQLAAAQNLNGPLAALDQPIRRRLPVPESMRVEEPRSPSHVTLRFATLGGYVVAKAAALDARGEAKDAYDLVFVALFNPDGPRGAAKAAKSLRLPPHRQSHFETTRSAFLSISAPEKHLLDRVIRQMKDAGDDAEIEQLRADIEYGVRTFLRAFDD